MLKIPSVVKTSWLAKQQRACCLKELESPIYIFWGLAGYTSEDVFMNEAKLAKQLFDDRFDAKDSRNIAFGKCT